MEKSMRSIILAIHLLVVSAAASFPSTFEIKKPVILANNNFVRLSEHFDLIRSADPAGTTGTPRIEEGFIELPLTKKIQSQTTSSLLTDYIFGISLSDLKSHGRLSYTVKISEDVRIRIYLGGNEFPRLQIYEKYLPSADSREMTLDIDEIVFRYIETAKIPKTTLLFRFESLQTRVRPEIELSQVRIGPSLRSSPNAVQRQNVRLAGRIIESLILPAGGDIVFHIAADKPWKIDGFLGAAGNEAVEYRLYADGRLVKQYECGGLAKEWVFFSESFPASSKGQATTVRLACSNTAQGILGNIVLSPLSAAGRAPQNIVLYLIDALRGDLGGVPFERLFFSEAFKTGTVYKNAFANATRTADSLPIIFTGKPKILLANDENAMPFVGEDDLTLAMSLKEKGFITAAFIANPWLVISNSHKGFDYIYMTWNDRIDELVPNRGGLLPFPLDAKTHDFIKRGNLFEEIANFVDRYHDKPFFIFVHTLETHAPYLLPMEKMSYSKNTDTDLIRSVFPNEAGFWYSMKNPNQNQIACVKNLYKDNVLDADNSFKNFYLTLRKKIPEDNLLLILTSDHGERLYEHGSWGHGSPDVYNEVIRIPLFIHTPRSKPAIVERIVQSLDLFPTILDWVEPGRAKNKEFLERSLLRIRDKKSSAKDFIFVEGTETSQFAFVTPSRKFIFSNDKISVFDLKKDPAEKNALSPIQSGVDGDEIARMLSFREALVRARRTSTPPSSAKISEEDKKRLKSLGYIK